jgi:hypothetical protein
VSPPLIHAQAAGRHKLRLRRLPGNGLNVTHSAHRCYLPACRAHLSCLRAALGGGLFNLRPTTPTRVWGVLFWRKCILNSKRDEPGFQLPSWRVTDYLGMEPVGPKN